ncbi:MAG TPA: 5-(carboxyamino)imidazole ribonucleotide synthase [Candidatus Saccharimonadales bacterium]|nr:5-(carboxyamino)imidazole ribonucleotide synthase [Candidatus Saccharimonadales bacterium]
MPKTIGIVGGGQLGRMLTEAAASLGFKVIVIDPTPDCPAHQAGAEQIVAPYRDREAAIELAQKADYITIEFEHINAEALATIADSKPVNPSPDTIKMIQNKYEQKLFLQRNDLNTAEFLEIDSNSTAETAFDDWGGLILKSTTDSFDGRGNTLITSKSELADAAERFAGREIYAEKIINFKKELAVMIAKDIKGNTIAYPVVETVHARNICTEVYAAAEIDEVVKKKAENLAKQAVSKLNGAGIYGVEMFLGEDNTILVNEIAPRVHNSGHYTMDMCEPSQFEQHILAITGRELKEPVLKSPACCMINILGERNGPVELNGVADAENIPGVSVYIYGKKPTKIDRKMGHINATAGTMEEAVANARKARKLIGV